MAQKWRGDVSDILPLPLDKAWPVLADFCGFAKNFPQVFVSCDTIEGETNKVGCVRALKIATPDGQVLSANERLLSLDNENHKTSYALEANTLGLSGYTGTVVASSHEGGKTKVTWTYECDPVANGTPEELYAKQQGLFTAIAKTAGQA